MATSHIAPLYLLQNLVFICVRIVRTFLEIEIHGSFKKIQKFLHVSCLYHARFTTKFIYIFRRLSKYSINNILQLKHQRIKRFKKYQNSYEIIYNCASTKDNNYFLHNLLINQIEQLIKNGQSINYIVKIQNNIGNTVS